MEIPDYRDEIPKHNPWWQDQKLIKNPPYKPHRRSDYPYHIQDTQKNNLFRLIGPQGIGKTTIIHQIIHDLIKKHETKPNQILYLPLEELLYYIKNDFLIETTNWYETHILGQDRKNAEPHYILIDGIHHIENWQKQIQQIIDGYPETHILVTSPTKQKLEIEPEKPVINTSVSLPQKYYDYISEKDLISIETKDPIYRARDSILESVEQNENKVLDRLVELKNKLDNHKELETQVNSYFREGGYIGQSWSEVRQNLELTLYKEIPRFHQIENPYQLHSLCMIVARTPFQEFGFKDLARQLGSDIRTIQKYINILEDFYILTPSYKYRHQRKRSFRLHLRDPGYINSLSNKFEDSYLHSSEHQYKLSQMVGFDHLKRLIFYYYRENREVYYWKDYEEEIDLVFELSDTPIPVTFTYQRSEEDVIESTKQFLDDHNSPLGLVVGPDLDLDKSDKIIELPYWLYLLIC